VRGERVSLDSSIERENHRWHQFWSPKWLKLVSTSSIRWWESYSGCFEPWYCLQNIFISRMRKFIRFDFMIWVVFWVYYFAKLVYTCSRSVYRVFLLLNGPRNEFFRLKTHSLDFLATTVVAKIWARRWSIVCLFFSFALVMRTIEA